MRRSPLRKISARKRSQSLAWERLRDETFERCENHCDLCGFPLEADWFDAHHRKARSQGGQDATTNLVALHRACHKWVHENPAKATVVGFICPSWANPSIWPVRVHGDMYMRPIGTRWVPSDPALEQRLGVAREHEHDRDCTCEADGPEHITRRRRHG